MATFGMTEEGFKPKRFADILDSIHTKIKNITDPTSGEHPFINEESDGVLMQTAEIIAEELSICWEQAYIAANQFDPLNASGAALRGLVQINGINPSYGSYTQIKVNLGGTPGAVIPKGSLIANQDSSQVFSIVETTTIGNNGTATAFANSLEKGEYNPGIGTIIEIQTPVFGWSYVSNTETVSVGTNPETDAQLHVKQQRATSATSYRQVDSIYAGLFNVPGVIFARVYVNDTLSTDSRGIGPKSIAPVVVGGTNEDVANSLRLKCDALATFQGNTSVQFTDDFGGVQDIKFTRPTQKDVYIDINISFTNTILWPENGYELIKKAIVEYAQYNYTDGSAGFGPGESVIISRLYTPINSVLGFKINSVKVGFSASTSASDLNIAWNEIARFDENKINITVG